MQPCYGTPGSKKYDTNDSITPCIIMLGMSHKIRNFLFHYGVLIFFAVYLAIGLSFFDDYGCGPDEGMERQTSLVNYKYVIEKLNLPVSEPVKTWLGYLPPLKEYRDRYYGTAVQIPMVLIESSSAFTMEPAEFYGIRHLYTFLNFFVAMICFYLLLKERFKHRGIALLGTAMLILTPRFFAESFYNNKDVLFLSWYIISIYFIFRWFRKKTTGAAIVAGILLAFTINTRLNGIVLIPLVILFAVIEQFENKYPFREAMLPLCILIVTCLVTFFIITPNYWESPVSTFLEAFAFNMKHPNHGSDRNLFFGNLVDSTKIWYFIPTWIVLTVPTCIVLLSVLGFGKIIMGFIRNRFSFFEHDEFFMDLFMTAAGLIPLLVIIFMRVIIYNGWRHCYFFYGTLIYLAVVGLQTVWEIKIKHPTFQFLKNALLFLGIGSLLIGNGLWIIRNHPFEYVYFAPLFRKYSDEFSGDYWGIASRNLLEYIVQTDDRPQIIVDHSLTNAGSINRGLLPEKDRDRLDLVYDTENADYIIFSRDDKTADQASFTGFKKVYSIRVDSDEIGIVFKRETEIN